jgi:hypothetical protein
MKEEKKNIGKNKDNIFVLNPPETNNSADTVQTETPSIELKKIQGEAAVSNLGKIRSETFLKRIK